MGLLKGYQEEKAQPSKGLLEGYRERKEQTDGGLLSGFKTEAVSSEAPFRGAGATGEWNVPRLKMEEFIDASARGLARMGSAFEQMQVGILAADTRGGMGFGATGFFEQPEYVKMRERAIKDTKNNAAFLWELYKNPGLAAQNEDLMSKALNLIGETLPYITATTAAFITTGPLGAFGVGSMVEGNSAYRTALDEGVPEEKAKMIGVAVGIVSGAIEAFGGRGAEALLLKATTKMKNKLMKAGAVLTIGSVIEALEEGAQEIAHLTGESTYRDVDWNEATNRTLGAMAGGAFLGGIMRGGSVIGRGATGALELQKAPFEMPPTARAKGIPAPSPETSGLEASEARQAATEELMMGGILTERQVTRIVSRFPQKITDSKSLVKVGNAIADDLGILHPDKWTFEKKPSQLIVSGEAVIKQFGRDIRIVQGGKPYKIENTYYANYMWRTFGLRVDVGKTVYPSQALIKRAIIHELLHSAQVIESTPTGRRRMHTPEFKRDVQEKVKRLFVEEAKIVPVAGQPTSIEGYKKAAAARQRRVAAQPPTIDSSTGKPRIITPQPTSIEKSAFADWATDFSSTRARDLGVPLILTDPKIRQWRLSTLKEVANAQRRYKKTYQKKLARRESPNVFNPWISARHAFMSLGEKTGVPLYHIYDNIMQKGGAANIKGFEEIASRVKIGELAKLTLEDNTQIAEWLFSPETRLRAESKITPDALKMAMKLEEILQGPAAKQVQEMVARRWIKSEKAPPDVWNYPTDLIVNKWMLELKDKKGASKLVKDMLRKGIPNQTELVTKITHAASKENWNAADTILAIKVLSDEGVQAEIRLLRDYPRRVLNSAMKAKANKTLPDHIANEAPWTLGLGVRKFYYLSDPVKADIIDDYIDSISLRALEKPQIPEGSMPGTISYEAYARKGHPGIKKGSVVNNVLTHLQRISIANAVADDMELMYDRLTQRVTDPLTGKDIARIPLSDSDSRTVKDIFNNLLMKRQIATRPWAIAVDVKRWFWRTRLSMIARPDAALWMSFRNALQNLGMGPTAFNVKETSKSMLKYASRIAQGKTMEEIDPQMYKRCQKDFPSYVSQRRAFYREFLLQDTANVSREFGNRRNAQIAASLLERTGGMYGAVDEYVNRMPLWIAQYQTTKNAAIRYKLGKINIKSFLAKTGLDTVRAEQKMMAQDLLDAGRINDLAAESANWMVEDVNLKYKTSERAGVEQTMAQRIFMGIYTFPRGAAELIAYRGVIPMMKGIDTGNWNQAKHGLINTLKGLAAGELAALILMTVMGKSAYDTWSKNRYELLGPGAGTIADLFGSIGATSYELSQGNVTLDQASNRLADAFSRNIDEFIPLMKIFTNTVETHYDTKSLNSWRLLRDTTSRKVLGKHVKWDYVSRSDYEKVMHLLVGSFEDSEGHVELK